MKLDKEVLELYKQWQDETGQYPDVNLTKVEFEPVTLGAMHNKTKVITTHPNDAESFLEISDIDERTKDYDLAGKIKQNLPKSAKSAPIGTIIISRVRPLLGSYTIIKASGTSFTSGDLNPIVISTQVKLI